MDFPVEILEIIFCEVLPLLFWDEGPPLQLGSKHAEFKILKTIEWFADPRKSLIETCRRWKQVVSGATPIWTRLVIDTATEKLTPDTLEGLLRRSRALSVDIMLVFNRSKSFSTDKYKRELIQVVSRHLHRIRGLRIHFEGVDDTGLLQQLFPVEHPTFLPSLERIYVTSKGFPCRDVRKRPTLGAIHAPKLERIYFSSSFSYIWTALAQPRNSCLMHLAFSFRESLSPTDWCSLSTSENLRSLYWCEASCPFPRTVPVKLTFPQLQSLTLFLPTKLTCNTLAEKFYTPHLKAFAAMFSFKGQLTWITPFLKCNRQLQQLMLSLLDSMEGAKEAFADLQTLQTLRISNCTLTESSLSGFLHQDEDGRTLLPQLQDLSVRLQYGIPMEPLLLKVIRRRLESIGTAFSFRILDKFRIKQQELDNLLFLGRIFPDNIFFSLEQSEIYQGADSNGTSLFTGL